MKKILNLLVPIAILLSPSIALAATKTSLSADINSGSLIITAPSVTADFTGVTLNGKVQKSYATLSNWGVTDATGTGNGWTVDLSASQLKEVPPSGGFASGTSAKVLPKGSLNLTGTRSVSANTGSKSVSTTGGPLLENVSATIDTSSPVEILKANTDYGMGTYTVHEPSNGLLLTLAPSSVQVDSVNYPSSPTPYESTLTYTIASAPSTTSTSTTPTTYPIASGMSGVGIPTASTLTMSGSYESTASQAFNGLTGTSNEWDSGAFSGWVQAVFPSPITLSGVQLFANQSASTPYSITVYGLTGGSWVQIGSASQTPPATNAGGALPVIPVASGTYGGLKISLSSSSSWVSLMDVTVQS